MHDDLDNAKLKRIDGLLHELDPCWKIAFLIGVVGQCRAHGIGMARIHNYVNRFNRDLIKALKQAAVSAICGDQPIKCTAKLKSKSRICQAVLGHGFWYKGPGFASIADTTRHISLKKNHGAVQLNYYQTIDARWTEPREKSKLRETVISPISTQGRTVLELNSMNTTHRKLFVALGLLAAGLFTAASAQEASQSKPESSADSRRFHFQIVVLFSSGFADSGLRQSPSFEFALSTNRANDASNTK
jgi:hypothetical protein